jgi:hypothetical protein
MSLLSCNNCCSLLTNKCSEFVKSVKHNKCTLCTIVTIIITLIFCSSIYGLYVYGDKFVISSDCPSMDVNNNIAFTYNSKSNWKYKYDFSENNNYYEVQQKCYSLYHDVNLLRNNLLISRIVYSSPFVTHNAYIKDCIGQIIYIIETSLVPTILLNYNNLFVSVLIRDPFNNVIGYIESYKYFMGRIDITDAVTHKIAASALEYNDQIQFMIYNAGSKVGNFRLLMSLAGHIAFSNKPLDNCNNYVYKGGIVVLCFTAILFVITLIQCYQNFNIIKNYLFTCWHDIRLKLKKNIKETKLTTDPSSDQKWEPVPVLRHIKDTVDPQLLYLSNNELEMSQSQVSDQDNKEIPKLIFPQTNEIEMSVTQLSEPEINDTEIVSV